MKICLIFLLAKLGPLVSVEKQAQKVEWLHERAKSVEVMTNKFDTPFGWVYKSGTNFLFFYLTHKTFVMCHKKYMLRKFIQR